MTAIQFLAEWALRSSILILSGALLLLALPVNDSSIRLAAWTAMLCGSLGIPALTAGLPQLPLTVRWMAAQPAGVPRLAPGGVVVGDQGTATTGGLGGFAENPSLTVGAPTGIYCLVALALLLRLAAGLAMSLRLLHSSRATGRTTEGIEIRESDRVAAPVALGIARPAIVLPLDWREWDDAKLEAVLAHERSHIRRRDPAVQLLSAVHRALLWHSPLSWFLHRRIVRIAEEASDDAAVAVTRDRARYAEVLLDFMQGRGRTPARSHWLGVPMARYGRPDARIHRILDATAFSRGLTRWAVAAILAVGSPLAYVVAAADPQSAPQAPPEAVAQSVAPAQPVRQPVRKAGAQAEPDSLTALGNVMPLYTVTIKSRVDGQLMSVSFQEGDLVHAGQVLASIDRQPYEIQVNRAEALLAQDQAALDAARADPAQAAMAAQLERRIRADRGNVAEAQLQLKYTQLVSPITGIAGLRLVDPGNMVHANDANGIVTIRQMQPIAVLFTIPEDRLPEVRARLAAGANVPVEAWDRTFRTKFATGRLTAVDNQIDPTTGTAQLKAVFDNQDGALFPNQFVNVRMPMNAH